MKSMLTAEASTQFRDPCTSSNSQKSRENAFGLVFRVFNLNPCGAGVLGRGALREWRGGCRFGYWRVLQHFRSPELQVTLRVADREHTLRECAASRLETENENLTSSKSA